MSLEPLEAQDERDVLEFLHVGLSRDDAVRLLDRLLTENSGNPIALVADAWLYGATAARNALSGRRVCHVCGCWEMHACEGGCSWVGPNLCSACQRPGAPLACEAVEPCA